MEVGLLLVLTALFIGFALSVHAASKNQPYSVLTKREVEEALKNRKQNDINE